MFYRINISSQVLAISTGELDQTQVRDCGRSRSQEHQVRRWSGYHVVQLTDGARRGVLAGPVLGVVELDEVAVVAFNRKSGKLCITGLNVINVFS